MTPQVHPDAATEVQQKQTSTPNEPELLACPFCGGEAQLEPKNWCGRDYVGVFCVECSLFMDSRASDESEAAKIWNTRPTPAAVGGDVAGLIEDARTEAETMGIAGQPKARALLLATANALEQIALATRPAAIEPVDVDERARELLAKALDAAGMPASAKFVREADQGSFSPLIAASIDAITAALDQGGGR